MLFQNQNLTARQPQCWLKQIQALHVGPCSCSLYKFWAPLYVRCLATFTAARNIQLPFEAIMNLAVCECAEQTHSSSYWPDWLVCSISCHFLRWRFDHLGKLFFSQVLLRELKKEIKIVWWLVLFDGQKKLLGGGQWRGQNSSRDRGWEIKMKLVLDKKKTTATLKIRKLGKLCQTLQGRIKPNKK